MEADRARTPLAARASRILVQSCPAGPAVEAVVDGRGWPILGWAVFPATPRFQPVQDAAYHPAIIDPASTGLVLRQMRLNRRPGIIAQPEQSAHPCLRRISAARTLSCYACS